MSVVEPGMSESASDIEPGMNESENDIEFTMDSGVDDKKYDIGQMLNPIHTRMSRGSVTLGGGGHICPPLVIPD